MVEKSHIKKIAIILPDLSAGGAQRMLVNMAHEYCRQGYDVSLVILTDAGALKDEALRDERLKLLVFGKSRAVSSLWGLVSFFKRERPDFVLSALTYVNILTVLAIKLSFIQTYLVVSERAYHSVNAKLTVRRYAFEKFLMRRFYLLADKVVGISRGVSENIKDVARLHDVVINRAHLVVGILVFDEIDNRHVLNSSLT